MPDEDPFLGSWELDASTLDYQAGRPGKRATYTIEPLPSGLKFTIVGEDADGKSLRFAYGGPIDGTPQDLPGGDGTLKLVLKRNSPASIESVLLRGDQAIDRWTREVSADGQAMTVIQHVRTPDGRELLNRSIYRRTP